MFSIRMQLKLDRIKLPYYKKHPTVTKEFKKAFTLTFLDSSEDQAELDYLESKWNNKLQAKINKNITVLFFYS